MNEYEKLEYIIKTVSMVLKMSQKNIFSSVRKRPNVFARQIIYYYARKYTLLSLAEIGLRAGKINHATVLYGSNIIKDMLTYDKSVNSTVRHFNKIFDRSISNKNIKSETIEYDNYSVTTHYSNGFLI